MSYILTATHRIRHRTKKTNDGRIGRLDRARIIYLFLGPVFRHHTGTFYKSKIIEAINENDMGELKRAITSGENVNQPTADGEYTPLDVAIMQQSNQIVEFLVKHGADVNARNKYGQTPLHIAVQNNNNQAILILLRHGCQVGIRDKTGRTALDLASPQIKAEILNFTYVPRIAS